MPEKPAVFRSGQKVGCTQTNAVFLGVAKPETPKTEKERIAAWYCRARNATMASLSVTECVSMKLGTVVMLLALILILAAVGFYVYKGFAIPGEPMPAEGWIALTLGVVFSLIVGIGLMTLVFYSSRQGYDEPTHFNDGE